MRRAILEFQRASSQDLAGDIAATQNQLAAIFANLRTTGKGTAKTLTAQQSRELTAIQRLISQSKAKSRAELAGTAQKARTRYGSALVPVVQQQLGVSKAVSRASRTVARGQAAGAKLLAAGGQQALGIAQAAAAEARAAADYALAAAIEQRERVDAETVAQMRFELERMRLDNKYALQQMRLASQLRIEEYRKQQEMAQELAKDDPAVRSGLAMAIDLAVHSFPKLVDLFNTPVDGKLPNNPADVANMYIASNPAVANDPNATAFVRAMADAMWSAGAGVAPGQLYGYQPDRYGPGGGVAWRQELAFRAIRDKITTLYPQFVPYADHILDSLRTGTESLFMLNALRDAENLMASGQVGEGELVDRSAWLAGKAVVYTTGGASPRTSGGSMSPAPPSVSQPKKK